MPTTLEQIEAGPLDPLDGPEGTAERLVLAAHRTVDWDVWGGARRVRYWDALRDRVVMACYRGPTLADWWAAMTRSLSLSEPYTKDERAELATLLAEPARPVLDALRLHADALVLRVRVLSDHKRQERAKADDEATTQDDLWTG